MMTWYWHEYCREGAIKTNGSFLDKWFCPSGLISDEYEVYAKEYLLH